MIPNILGKGLMKRYILLCCVTLTLLCGCTHQRFESPSKDMDCVSSIRTGADNYTEEWIKIVLNTEEISVREIIAAEVIDHYQANDFHSVRFNSQANKVKVSVYLQKEDKSPVMVFSHDFQTQKYDWQD